MRDNALYFPYISVPDDQWTFKTLLYWDKLSSIVPFDYVDEPSELTPFMRELVRERLVEQVFPSQHLHMIPEFSTRFETMIRARAPSMRRSRRTFNSRRTQVLIHMEKMGEIPAVLAELGFATAIDWCWYSVDAGVAELFMAYLAACLGGLPDVNATPVTNEAKYCSVFGNINRAYSRSSTTHRDKARQVILRGLLPSPKEPISLGKLIRFKERHGHLLPAFRREVEAHCFRIACLADPLERLAATDAFVSGNRQRMEEIVAAMRPTWKQIGFGSLTPLFGAGLTLHATTSGNVVSYAGAALTFVGAAYQALASIRHRPEAFLRSPLAYVAHARYAFGAGTSPAPTGTIYSARTRSKTP